MFVAMNHFEVAPGFEGAFEGVWRARKTHLDEMPGFVDFHPLRGPAGEDHTLYALHTGWASEGDFRAWTNSEQLRDAAGCGPLRMRDAAAALRVPEAALLQARRSTWAARREARPDADDGFGALLGRVVEAGARSSWSARRQGLEGEAAALAARVEDEMAAVQAALGGFPDRP